MTEFEGKAYCTEMFNSYKKRARVILIDEELAKHSMDIYTTATDADVIEEAVRHFMTDKVKSLEIDFIADRRSDDAAHELIKNM